ncbi:hypothetical protein BJY04DRAFT_233158 [Aspergillus karnatakaensis]|uniref:uncharacterized protein n=1 Tax=Aspergillus karnatakaensis TaxID=1810916 RepID=UPI003CCCF065
MELTVAEVSGLIAAGVFVLQILIPLAIPWALIAFLSQENSVITWTVLGRFLHSSLWPTILSSSTAETAGVPWRIYLTSWAQTVLLFVISVASICSPLGLYTSIEPAGSATNRAFQYVADNSAFGYGTPLRGPGQFTRFCGLNAPCPGTTINKTCERQGLAEVCNNTVYESRIPDDLMRLFNDGVAGFSPTVSSIFDIQYRMYRNSTAPNSLLPWYTKPDYRTMSVQILEEKVKLVEGLITDFENGGIGFRNHTAPGEFAKYGTTWKEDILFIEPKTQCVPLNLSIGVVTPPWNFNGRFLDNVSLVDEGGFSNLARIPPEFPESVINGQEFDLKDRAFKAAWLNNYYTMLFLNVTDPLNEDIGRVDSTEGQKFELGDGASNNFTIAFSGIQTNINYGAYLHLTTSRNRTYNPHNVTALLFGTASTACGGTTSQSASNINSSLIACGLVLGAATRTDGGDNRILDPDTPWTIPMYSCATVMKAVVKTAELQYNGTGLAALEVRSLRPKEYANAESVPVWGVEELGDHSIDVAPPMWGIIGPNGTHSGLVGEYNISMITSESLYLPGYMDQNYPLLRGLNAVPLGIGQNLPGVEFYNQALMTAYTIGAAGFNHEADYSGGDSLALYTKWQNLSQNADSAASIINLVWTDIATNAVVGTKGWGLNDAASSLGILSAPNDPVASSVQVPVTMYGSHIRYRIPFAVPAFVTLGATTGLLALLIILLIMKRTGIKRLRLFLESTTVGRIISPLIQSEIAATDTPEPWIKTIGPRRVTITSDAIAVDSLALETRALLNDPPPTIPEKAATPEITEQSITPKQQD